MLWHRHRQHPRFRGGHVHLRNHRAVLPDSEQGVTKSYRWTAAYDDVIITFQRTQDCVNHNDGDGFNNDVPDCLQEWELSAEIMDNTTCSIDGDYVVEVRMECNANPTNLCDSDILGTANNGSGSYAAITFSLQASSICPEIVADITLQGSLKSYDSADFNNESSAFEGADTVFYRSHVSSDQAEVYSTRIRSIAVTQDIPNDVTLPNGYLGNEKIWNDYAESTWGGAVNLSVNHDVENSKYNDFNFKLSPTYFPVTNAGKDYEITCVIDVTYKTNQRRLMLLDGRHLLDNGEPRTLPGPTGAAGEFRALASITPLAPFKVESEVLFHNLSRDEFLEHQAEFIAAYAVVVNVTPTSVSVSKVENIWIPDSRRRRLAYGIRVTFAISAFDENEATEITKYVASDYFVPLQGRPCRQRNQGSLY